MIKIGLSGTRYSGKDSVAKLFKQIGIPVFNADIVLKFILKYNYELLQEIRNRIGSRYFKEGVLDSNLIMRDDLFNDVLDIVIPDILMSYQNFEEKNKQSIYTIFHSSILFDREDIYNKMDYTISVYTPLVQRVDRACFVMGDNSFDNRIFMNNLLSTEKDELSKNKLSSFIIHNYNDIDILNQVNEIDKKLIDAYLKSIQTMPVKKDKVEVISDNFIRINLGVS
jgi:dephospho-CoA kinase